MAIAAMRRFDLLGHASTREAVLATLQTLGITHVTDAAARLEAGAEAPPVFQPPPDGSAVEATLQTVKQCLAFVERYAPKRTLGEQLREPRLRVTQAEIDRTVENFALDTLAKNIRDLEARFAATRTQITKHEVLSADLRHWDHLDCDCEEVRGTERVNATLAVVDTAALPKLEEELATVTPYVHLEVLERDRPSSYLLLLVLRDVAETVNPVLKKFGLRMVDFGNLRGTPQEARERLTEQIELLEERLAGLTGEARALATQRRPLLILADYYSDAAAVAEVQTQMAHTHASYYLTGWVPERDSHRLQEAVHAVSPTIMLEVHAASPKDNPPILLENKASSPFQLITEMYGTPRYLAADPTPWFAPWFAVFFGLCLTDAGYGFILTGLLGWALMRFKLEGGVQQLARILLFGSVCTIVAGALTGGWFGIAPESLPGPLRRLTLLNPMLDGVQAFRLTLGIGVVQVWLGLFILLRNNLKHGHVAAAVWDQGVWLVFIPCLAVLLYTGMFGGTIENALVMGAAKYGALVCTALVVLTGSREGTILTRPLMGLAKLYDVMGYFGDVLSYSRLFALGLATGAIGAVTNTMAGMAGDLPFGLGYLVAPLVLLAGHSLNVVINALGAFIHSMRLQFIEFFGKFFEDGGTPFRPFAEAQTYTAVERA